MIRVLVVEDEPVAAEAHRAYVERTAGFTAVAVAGTGAHAVAVLSRTPVDLVLLDIDPGTAVGVTGIPGGDLVTIVGNLVDNAIDAALQGEPPREVRLAAWVDAGRLEIRVEDSGPGLTARQVTQAFERGWTTKTTTSASGRGLGLALVRQAVQRNGGTVTCRPGPGAEFCVSLPVGGLPRELR